MAELDSLIDSMLQQRNGSGKSSLEEKYADQLDIKQTFAKGQGVFAKRLFSINEPICSLSYPTMMAIDLDDLPRTCYECLFVTATKSPIPEYGYASTELKTCSGCNIARFCNRACQVKAWHAYHKYECKIFKKLQHNLPPAMLRAVLRIVLLKDRDKLSDDEWSLITSLTSHQQESATRVRSNLTDMAESIKYLAVSGMSIETIQQLVFIMKFNAVELPTPVYGSIGVMLDPLVGKINHSCQPNIAIYRPQHTMVSGWKDSTQLPEDKRKTFAELIPVRDIQEGEELLNCYVVPTVSVKDRKKRIKEEYFFGCNCSRCVSDTQAALDLTDQQSGLATQFERWTKDVDRHCSRIGHESNALSKAAAAMDKSNRYLEYPVLYTTGDFPQLSMRLIQEGLKSGAFDVALVNALRIYFFINPHRFVGRHNPTNIYTIFLILDIFDALLAVSIPPGVTSDKVEKWLRNLSDRGISKDGLIYWRHRIREDLDKRLESTAAQDLLVLVKKREEQNLGRTVQKQDSEEEDTKISAEGEMRSALKLEEDTWKTALQQSGC